MSMGPHHCVVVLAFLALLHTTVAKYEWTGKEWRWVSSKRSSSRDDEDFGSGDDEEEGDGQEPPSGLVENLRAFEDQSSITVWWQPPSRETWNSCLLGYRIRYHKLYTPETPFETVEGTYEDKESGKDYFFEEVEGTNHSYVIRNLDSETSYAVAVQVFNPWGKNQNLKEIEVTTKPEPCLEPSVPHADHLVETGTHMIKLQMGGWVDANCITDHLTVQGRLKGEEEWSSAASRVEPGEEFTLRYLTPATWFHVKVTGIPLEYHKRTRSANSTTWEFEVATLAEDGSGFPGCVIERGVKYSGSNLSNMKGISQRTCALLCFRTSSCTHWTYNEKFQGGKCWLKSSNKGRTRSTKGSNSGQRACGAKGFSLSTLNSEAAAAMEECRDPWSQLSTGCYLFQPRNSTWYEAKQNCKQSGGHLVEIDSMEEMNTLRRAMDSESWDDTNVEGVWIGLNDVFHDGTWVWDHSGTPLEFSMWAPSEPDNFRGAQHCGASLKNMDLTLSHPEWAGEWFDVSCEENQLHLGTICEAPGASEELVPTYARETGKGWVNERGRASSMPTGVSRTRRRGKKTYLRVHDVEECERECTATAPCVAFTFIPLIHRCDLKADADAVRLEDVGGAVSGKLNGERPTPPTPPESVQNSTICLPCLPACSIEAGVKYSGHNLYPAKGKTQMECAALCLHEPECNHWTHNARLGKCWLKKSDRGRSPSTHGSSSGQKSCGVTESDLASGRVVRTACSCESECTIEENVKFSGHNLYTRKGIKGGNQEACAALCYKDAKCKFWTYNPRVKKCWLKTSDEGRTASTKGSVSGEKACGAPALKNSKEAGDTDDSKEAEVAEDVGESLPLKGVMMSPNFVYEPQPGQRITWDNRYPPDVHETKTIEVPKGKKIKIQFSHFMVESCCDYVRITDGDGTLLGKYHYKPKKDIVSRTDTVHVLFHSDSSAEREGWRLEWEAIEDATSFSDNCASPWTQLSTGCYLFLKEPKTWFQADRTCQEQNSFLVEIDSAEENSALLGEILKSGVASGVPAWLGLTQIGDEGNWTLMSSATRGQAPKFLNWERPARTFETPADCAIMFTVGGTWNRLKCSSNFSPSFLVICEKSTPVKLARNEGIKVGDLVRVRASVTRPEYGWGYVNHTSIGPVHSLEKDEVVVDFPEQPFWIGLTSELEVVDHSGVFGQLSETTTTTTQRPEDGLSVDIKMGDKVRVRDSIGTPFHGWGNVDHTSVGTVRVLPSEGGQTLVIDFPEQSSWSGLLSELEVVPDDTSDEESSGEPVPPTIFYTKYQRVEPAMAEQSSDPGCILADDTLEYNCHTENVNFQNRENSEVVPGIESWRCCRQLCSDSDNCNFWVWAHQGAGPYAGNCALMSGYGNTADDANVISGPKICI